MSKGSRKETVYKSGDELSEMVMVHHKGDGGENFRLATYLQTAAVAGSFPSMLPHVDDLASQ